jgi:integrase
MSGRRVQHLVVWGKSFQVRLYVPVDLQPVLDRKELRWSVRTREPSVAKTRALNATLAFQRLCDKLRLMKKLSVDEAREIAQAFYQKLADSYETPEPMHPADQDRYDHTQEQIVEEIVLDLGREISNQVYSGQVVTAAKAAVGQAGYDFPGDGTEAFRAICQGIARAQIEHAQYTLFRQQDLLSRYEPQDELFRGLQPAARTVMPGAQLQSIAIDEGLPLAVAIEEYKAHLAQDKNLAVTTTNEIDRYLTLMVELWGAETGVRTLTDEHVEQLYTFTRGLRSGAKQGPDGVAGMTTDDPAKRLSAKTSGKYFGHGKSFFKWMRKFGKTSVLLGEYVHPPTGNDEEPGRKPWSEDQLAEIFRSPLFAGHKSVRRLTSPGKRKSQNGLYWLFLLAFYTGMRLGEICQVRIMDVCLNEDVSHIDLTQGVSVKTKASARRIPLHPDLFHYGFDKFVLKRSKDPTKRLFFEVPLGAKGRLTQKATKLVNRYLVGIGVKPKGRSDVSFHSFRHSFRDAAVSSDVQTEIIDQLMGHAHGFKKTKYGVGAHLVALSKAVGKIDFGLPEDVRALLKANALK